MCVYNDGAWEGKRKPKVVKLKRPRRGRPRKDEVWPPPNREVEKGQWPLLQLQIKALLVEFLAISAFL